MRRRGNVINEYREQLQRQASEAAAAAERNRLARDLHDSIKQQIFSIRMSAMVAQAQIEANVAKAHEALADIQQSATEAQVELQALLQQLRSSTLEHTSFTEAIQTQARALEYRSGAQVQVELGELPLDSCPLPTQEAAFRIVQEAFANIARHARAHRVTCSIACDSEVLYVVVRDDGQGFDLQGTRKGMGLANIQERARGLDGTVLIESAPGEGTSICVQIPLPWSENIKREREQQAQDRAARARAGLQLRSTMAIFALLVLLIDIAQFTTHAPAERRELALFILGFCLFLMLYGLVSARIAIARLRTHSAEKERELGALRLQEHTGWTSSLRLALFASWHIVFWIWHIFWPAGSWKAVALFLFGAVLLLALILFEQRRLKDAADSYYRLLSDQELRRAVARHWNTLRLRVILALCVGISFFVNGVTPFWPPVSLWQWIVSSFFFAFFIQCLCIAIDVWWLQPWRKLAIAVARKSVDKRLEGDTCGRTGYSGPG